MYFLFLAFSILLSGSLRILYIKYIYLMISSTPIIIVYTKNIHADDIIIYAVFLVMIKNNPYLNY